MHKTVQAIHRFVKTMAVNTLKD